MSAETEENVIYLNPGVFHILGFLCFRMPPKRKKVGRPPGSKNKKTLLAKHKKKVPKKAVDSDIIVKPAFSCKECKKKFRFRESYKAHLQNEHSKAPGSIPCHLCPVTCPDKETLMKHIDNYHERESHVCPNCNKEFTRRSHVMRHMNQRGCGGRISIHFCEICNATFTRKDNLMVHLRLQHIARDQFTCKHCMYHTKNFSKLIIHVQKNHSEKPLQFECDHCGKVTGSRAAITKHLEIHGEKKFKCDVCGYATFTLEVLRRHIFTHVEDKPHKCFICGCSYIQRVQLNRHMEKHTGHICLECGKGFPNKTGLIIHVREHKGLQKLFCPFENCSYSKKEFVNSNSLKAHVKIHLEERSYECEVCLKRFHREAYMRKHVLTHTLERPRRCMYCVAARAYVRGEQLLRHVRLHHTAVFRDHLTHVRQVLVCSTLYCNMSMCRHVRMQHTAVFRDHLTHVRQVLVCSPLYCNMSMCRHVRMQHTAVFRDHLTHVRQVLVCSPLYCNTSMCRHVRLHHTAVFRDHLTHVRQVLVCSTLYCNTSMCRHVRLHHTAVFRDHLTHVRQVLGLNIGTERVSKSELDAILNVLDAESERILEGYGTGVLYGGMMEQDESINDETTVILKSEDNPLMSEEELAESLKKLLEQLIDKKTLDVFGWPDETVDTMLEKVIEHCGARAADRDKWTRVQRLRENAKHLFVYVIEDKNITRMLDTHTIDQIIKHILAQVASDNNGAI
ncbi:unnamed protein product [Parnassius apollo]|uniref:(apollo) hypothetical protein n=1 Tax=Parnassius apollo TaxID=110799 RepID=A0A8S3WDR3_PARAO|nr:unnamed protein product [Parnassius apollo]